MTVNALKNQIQSLDLSSSSNVGTILLQMLSLVTEQERTIKAHERRIDDLESKVSRLKNS